MHEYPKDDELPPISYSVDDAARVIGIGPATVWKWVSAKELPVIKIGRRTIIRHHDLVAFVERHRQP
jgi:excisionase family DNA binding protein